MWHRHTQVATRGRKHIVPPERKHIVRRSTYKWGGTAPTSPQPCELGTADGDSRATLPVSASTHLRSPMPLRPPASPRHPARHHMRRVLTAAACFVGAGRLTACHSLAHIAHRQARTATAADDGVNKTTQPDSTAASLGQFSIHVMHILRPADWKHATLEPWKPELPRLTAEVLANGSVRLQGPWRELAAYDQCAGTSHQHSMVRQTVILMSEGVKGTRIMVTAQGRGQICLDARNRTQSLNEDLAMGAGLVLGDQNHSGTTWPNGRPPVR